MEFCAWISAASPKPPLPNANQGSTPSTPFQTLSPGTQIGITPFRWLIYLFVVGIAVFVARANECGID